MYDLFLSPFLPFDFVHQALGKNTLDYVAPAGLAQLTTTLQCNDLISFVTPASLA